MIVDEPQSGRSLRGGEDQAEILPRAESEQVAHPHPGAEDLHFGKEAVQKFLPVDPEGEAVFCPLFKSFKTAPPQAGPVLSSLYSQGPEGRRARGADTELTPLHSLEVRAS